jgi:hypothetical protein
VYCVFSWPCGIPENIVGSTADTILRHRVQDVS